MILLELNGPQRLRRGYDSKDVVLSASLYKLKVSDNLQYCLKEIGGFGILLFLLYNKDEGGIFATNVHQHGCLEVRFDTAIYVWRRFNK